jgi:hypothetical protein
MSQTHNGFGLSDRIAWGFRNASAYAMLFVAVFGACAKQTVRARELSPVASNASAASRSKVAPLTLGELIKLAGEPCDTAPEGARCKSDESDFELIPDCAAHSYYAAVKNSMGAAVLSRCRHRTMLSDLRFHPVSLSVFKLLRG